MQVTLPNNRRLLVHMSLFDYGPDFALIRRLQLTALNFGMAEYENNVTFQQAITAIDLNLYSNHVARSAIKLLKYMVGHLKTPK